MCCEESASGASEGLGADRFSHRRGRGRCRHCLSCQSTTLRLLYKCQALWRSGTPRVEAISGAPSTPQTFRGDASSRNEKSDTLASCLQVEWVLFRPLAIRHAVSPGHIGATRRAVRKHRAPNGALRRCSTWCFFFLSGSRVRKHRAPNGALRLHIDLERNIVDIVVSESTERQKVH